VKTEVAIQNGQPRTDNIGCKTQNEKKNQPNKQQQKQTHNTENEKNEQHEPHSKKRVTRTPLKTNE